MFLVSYFETLFLKTQTSAHTSNQEHVHCLNMWFFRSRVGWAGSSQKLTKDLSFWLKGRVGGFGSRVGWAGSSQKLTKDLSNGAILALWSL